MTDRTKAIEALRRLGWREDAHRKLDEALDLYEQGEPLWITTSLGWVADRWSDKLVITIRDDLL